MGTTVIMKRGPLPMVRGTNDHEQGSHPSVLHEEGVGRTILHWRVLGCDTFEEQIVGSCSVIAGRDADGACHLPMICTKLAQKGMQVNLLPAFEFLPIDGFWVKLFIIEQLC